jgi:dipeptidyl aminopeptidase/acylaminoacyl peptidase
MNFDGSELHRLTQYPAAHKLLKWSPTGEYLAFTVYRGESESNLDDLYVISISDQRIVHLAKVALWSSFDWSPDGRSIVFVGGNELSVDKGLYSVVVKVGYFLSGLLSHGFGMERRLVYYRTPSRICAAIKEAYQKLYVMNVVPNEEVQVLKVFLQIECFVT